jgi:Holliday junction resolvase-like predicted endonuclease
MIPFSGTESHRQPQDAPVPERLSEVAIDLEARLEEWIAKDPSLIRSGLTIVGRQMRTEGGPLDLLGIGLQGEWAVVEIKRGVVRRETIAQGLDYASCIDEMTEEKLFSEAERYLQAHGQSLKQLRAERPEAFDAVAGKRKVEIIVVGTGRDDGLERIVNLLSKRGQLAISVVTFQVFKLASGEQVLVRQLTESDEAPEPKERTRKASEEALCRSAAAFGFGKEFAAIIEAADRLGLHKYVTNKSVMVAPMADRRRCLFLVYADKLYKGTGLRTCIVPTAFEEFFNIPAKRVRDLLGHAEWGCLTKERTASFLHGLEKLMQEAKTPEASP